MNRNKLNYFGKKFVWIVNIQSYFHLVLKEQT